MIYSSTAARIEEALPAPIRRKKNQIEYRISKLWSRAFMLLSKKRVVLLRRGVPLLVMLLAFLMGWYVPKLDSSGRTPFLLLAPLGIPVALITLHYIITRFEWSANIILFMAIFVPIKLPTGTASTIVDSLLFAFIFTGNWIAKMVLVDKRNTLLPSPVNTPFYGFAIITFVSLFWSIAFRDPLVSFKGNFPVVQGGSAIVNIMLPVTLFLVSNHINSMKQLHLMVIMMMIGGALGWVTRFGGLKPPQPLGINDGGLFTMWVAILGVSMMIFNKKLAWKWRITGLTIGLMLQFYRFLFNLAWLAGWFPGFLALGVILFRRSKLLVVVVAIGVMAFVVINADMLNAAMAEESEKSGETRAFAWQTNWRVTSKHLLLGSGQAAYINYYLTYFSNEGFQVQATHNTILDILAQNGFFGLFFVLWYFIALSLHNYKVCLRFEGRDDFSEALANACLAGTVSSGITMAFGDWMFPFAYTQTIAGYDYIVYSWLFMGTGLALDRLIPESEAPRVGLSIKDNL
jgi:hypothetical protein